jgi:hypothetical protein
MDAFKNVHFKKADAFRGCPWEGTAEQAKELTDKPRFQFPVITAGCRKDDSHQLLCLFFDQSHATLV